MSMSMSFDADAVLESTAAGESPDLFNRAVHLAVGTAWWATGPVRLGGRLAARTAEAVISDARKRSPWLHLRTQGRSGRTLFKREVVPFWTIALAGWLLSTGAVALVSEVGDPRSLHRTVIVSGASMCGFTAVWLLRYVFLDRVVFRRA